MSAKTWGDLAYIGTAVSLILLSGGFLVLTRWWTTWLGRVLAHFMAVLLLIMTWTFLLLTDILELGASGVYLLRAILFTGLFVASLAMLVGFVKVQIFPRGWRSWRSTRRNSAEEVP